MNDQNPGSPPAGADGTHDPNEALVPPPGGPVGPGRPCGAEPDGDGKRSRLLVDADAAKTDGARLLVVDVEAGDSVLHVIDHVLTLPS